MELFYRKLGTGGQPLIILHGVFGSSDNWLTLGRRFAEHFDVYLVDQRNHGRSPHDSTFTYDAMKEDLRDFIEQQGLDNPLIIGHSMGGKVAMQFALDYPTMYDKLIVVDIAPRPYPVHHDTLLEGMQALDLGALKSRGQADKELATYEPILGVRQFLLKNLYRTDEGAFAWRINLPVIAQNIEKISIEIEGMPNPKPTLFIRGLKSHYISDDDFAHIRQLFPQATFSDFPTAGHWVHAESPEAFYSTAMEFLG